MRLKVVISILAKGANEARDVYLQPQKGRCLTNKSLKAIPSGYSYVCVPFKYQMSIPKYNLLIKDVKQNTHLLNLPHCSTRGKKID